MIRKGDYLIGFKYNRKILTYLNNEIIDHQVIASGLLIPLALSSYGSKRIKGL